MKRKINLVQLLAIALFATSITLFDYENPTWSENAKNYIGFLIALGLLALDRRKRK
jgi:hypothetical protein